MTILDQSENVWPSWLPTGDGNSSLLARGVQPIGQPDIHVAPISLAIVDRFEEETVVRGNLNRSRDRHG